MPKYAYAELLRTRMKQAHEIAGDPDGTLPELAKTWGVTVAGASLYLRRHDQALRDHFGDRKGNGNLFSKEDALFRLRFVKKHTGLGHSRKKCAELLGIPRSGLHTWLRRWAPDGVDQAIEDLEDDDETADTILCSP